MLYNTETAWHVAAYLGNLKVLEKLWEWAKEKLTAKEINKLLLATESEGRSAWHWAAQNGNVEVLQNMRVG